MKQTAVEWLYSRMFDKNSILTKEEYYKVKKAYYKAKEIEKQQMIEFANSFYNNCAMAEGGWLESPEEYYNDIL